MQYHRHVCHCIFTSFCLRWYLRLHPCVSPRWLGLQCWRAWSSYQVPTCLLAGRVALFLFYTYGDSLTVLRHTTHLQVWRLQPSAITTTAIAFLSKLSYRRPYCLTYHLTNTSTIFNLSSIQLTTVSLSSCHVISLMASLRPLSSSSTSTMPPLVSY